MTLIINAILQARTSSSRLPGKVMLKIDGEPMIGIQIKRIKRSLSIDSLIVAISDDKSDDELARYLAGIDCIVVRGSLHNVHNRFIKVLDDYRCDIFIRLTADCPLVMPELIDEMIADFKSKKIDYLSNSLISSFPDGLDIEIIDTKSFLKTDRLDLTSSEKEHVTLALYTRENLFKVANFASGLSLANERWTVDYPEDFDFIVQIFSQFKGKEAEFSMSDVLDLLESNPNIRNMRSGDLRNIALKREDGEQIG